MLFGDNAKKVYNLILEFIATMNDISPGRTEGINGVDGLSYVYLLARIAEDFIVKPKFKNESIFNSISDAYNGENGVELFIDYKEAMEMEKKLGFRNLALITKNKVIA